MLSASTAAALARAGNAARPGEPPLRLADYMLTPWKRCGLPVLTMDGTAVKQARAHERVRPAMQTRRG